MGLHIRKEFLQHGMCSPSLLGRTTHSVAQGEKREDSHREAHKSACILTLKDNFQKLQWREKLRWRREAGETKQEEVWIMGGECRYAV